MGQAGGWATTPPSGTRTRTNGLHSSPCCPLAPSLQAQHTPLLRQSKRRAPSSGKVLFSNFLVIAIVCSADKHRPAPAHAFFNNKRAQQRGKGGEREWGNWYRKTWLCSLACPVPAKRNPQVALIEGTFKLCQSLIAKEDVSHRQLGQSARQVPLTNKVHCVEINIISSSLSITQTVLTIHHIVRGLDIETILKGRARKHWRLLRFQRCFPMLYQCSSSFIEGDWDSWLRVSSLVLK